MPYKIPISSVPARGDFAHGGFCMIMGCLRGFAVIKLSYRGSIPGVTYGERLVKERDTPNRLRVLTNDSTKPASPVTPGMQADINHLLDICWNLEFKFFRRSHAFQQQWAESMLNIPDPMEGWSGALALMGSMEKLETDIRVAETLYLKYANVIDRHPEVMDPSLADWAADYRLDSEGKISENGARERAKSDLRAIRRHWGPLTTPANAETKLPPVAILPHYAKHLRTFHRIVRATMEKFAETLPEDATFPEDHMSDETMQSFVESLAVSGVASMPESLNKHLPSSEPFNHWKKFVRQTGKLRSFLETSGLTMEMKIPFYSLDDAVFIDEHRTTPPHLAENPNEEQTTLASELDHSEKYVAFHFITPARSAHEGVRQIGGGQNPKLVELKNRVLFDFLVPVLSMKGLRDVGYHAEILGGGQELIFTVERYTPVAYAMQQLYEQIRLKEELGPEESLDGATPSSKVSGPNHRGAAKLPAPSSFRLP